MSTEESSNMRICYTDKLQIILAVLTFEEQVQNGRNYS